MTAWIAQLVERGTFNQVVKLVISRNPTAAGSSPALSVYPYGLVVRIAPFQGASAGSIPAMDTFLGSIAHMVEHEAVNL